VADSPNAGAPQTCTHTTQLHVTRSPRRILHNQCSGHRPRAQRAARQEAQGHAGTRVHRRCTRRRGNRRRRRLNRRLGVYLCWNGYRAAGARTALTQELAVMDLLASTALPARQVCRAWSNASTALIYCCQLERLCRVCARCVLAAGVWQV